MVNAALDAVAAAEALDLTQDELKSAWQVAEDAGMLGQAGPRQADVLSDGDPEAVLALWDEALCVILRSTELDGLVTALYTVGGPVRIDALFEAYDTARRRGCPAVPCPAIPWPSNRPTNRPPLPGATEMRRTS